MTFHPWALLIAVPPVLAFFFLVWKVRYAESGKRFPFSDVLLRPPGGKLPPETNPALR
jgi:hypothetical protein